MHGTHAQQVQLVYHWVEEQEHDTRRRAAAARVVLNRFSLLFRV